jgi:GT2 family glycosyltransferase
MKKNPNGLISVILVNYNGYKDTVECVKSILKSNYDNFNIIIVENGSEDYLKIKNDSFLNENCTVLSSKENLGFSGGNNLAINYAKEHFSPDYYFLLNNDTIIESDAIEKLVDVYRYNCDVGIVTGKILYYSMKDTIWSAGGKFDFRTGIADQPDLGKKDSTDYDRVNETTFCTGCVMLIPSYVVRKVGLLRDDYFLYAEDTDYCCRIMNAGYKLYYTGYAKIYHKVSASTGKSSDLSQYYNVRNNLYIIKRFCTNIPLGYGKRWYRTIKSIVKGELTFSNVLKGYIDFKKGILGKKEF